MKLLPTDMTILMEKQTVRAVFEEMKKHAKERSVDNNINLIIDESDIMSVHLQASVVTLDEFLWPTSQ